VPGVTGGAGVGGGLFGRGVSVGTSNLLHSLPGLWAGIGSREPVWTPEPRGLSFHGGSCGEA